MAFTDWDRDCALAWDAEQAMRCPGCGHDRLETMDPDLEDEWVARPMRCHACATRERRAKGFDEKSRPGLQWVVERR